VGRYQKGKTSLDFTGARDIEWQWHLLGHMQVCTSLQTDYHASTSPLSFFRGRMPFLPPNQQRQRTEGSKTLCGIHEYRYILQSVLIKFWNISLTPKVKNFLVVLMNFVLVFL